MKHKHKPSPPKPTSECYESAIYSWLQHWDQLVTFGEAEKKKCYDLEAYIAKLQQQALDDQERTIVEQHHVARALADGIRHAVDKDHVEAAVALLVIFFRVRDA